MDVKNLLIFNQWPKQEILNAVIKLAAHYSLKESDFEKMPDYYNFGKIYLDPFDLIFQVTAYIVIQ